MCHNEKHNTAELCSWNRWLRWNTLYVFHYNFFRERMPSIVADWLGEGVFKSQPRLFVHSFVPLALLLLLRCCVAVGVLCPVGGSGQQGQAGLHQVTSSNTGMDFLSVIRSVTLHKLPLLSESVSLLVGTGTVT